MKFGENLQNLRKQKRMSQEQLAEKVDVSRQSISKWERGESYPTMNNIMTLCDIFHCKLNDLVHEEITDFDSLDEEIIMNAVKFKKEKQQKMKGLSKAIYVIARICKIVLIITIVILLGIMASTPYLVKNTEIIDNQIVFNGAENGLIVIEEKTDSAARIRMQYKNIVIADASQQNEISLIKDIMTNYSKGTILCYFEMGCLFAVIYLILSIIILRHLEKLFVNINNGDTPFTLENVTHIKKMAYLMIAAIVLPFAAGSLFEMIMKTDLNVEFEMYNVIEILFLFSMAYIFEYGYEIQLDSKGKIYGDENESENV